jgi:hypothetical protein
MYLILRFVYWILEQFRQCGIWFSFSWTATIDCHIALTITKKLDGFTNLFVLSRVGNIYYHLSSSPVLGGFVLLDLFLLTSVFFFHLRILITPLVSLNSLIVCVLCRMCVSCIESHFFNGSKNIQWRIRSFYVSYA